MCFVVLSVCVLWGFCGFFVCLGGGGGGGGLGGFFCCFWCLFVVVVFFVFFVLLLLLLFCYIISVELASWGISWQRKRKQCNDD